MDAREQQLIDIRFFVDGNFYACRQWMAVPRKDDEIMLGPEQAKIPYRVTRIMWGVEGPERDTIRSRPQAVNVELKQIRDGK